MDFSTRFELLEKLGSGSFATVYRARDNELGREVAVKQIHQQYLEDPDQLSRYWQEAQLLASLQHPNIVTIYDIDRARGWLILELMQSNLAERTQGRQMDLRALKTTVAHALRALKYLHERGIIHGDVKPSNLMVDHRRRVKLGDFGLARRASDDEGSLLKGTTRYMAPEVVSDEFGEVGPRSDLYSLGFTAYDLMCGSNFESLFPGLSAFGRNKQVAWMMWHAAADRRLPPVNRVLQGVPPELARVIDRLVAKDQTQRYASAEEALDDLGVDQRASRATVSVSAPTTDDEPSSQTAASDKKRLGLAAAAFGLSLIMSLTVLLWPTGDETVVEDKVLIRYIAEIYQDSGELKVEDAEKTFAEKLSLGPQPRIRLTNTGRNILFEELQPGDRLEIEERPGPDGEPIKFVAVTRPETDSGTLRRIDPIQQEIVIAVDSGEHRDDIRTRVLAGSEIIINESRNRSFTELQQGDLVRAWHLPDLADSSSRVLTRLEVRRAMNRVAYFISFRDPDGLRVQFDRGDTADETEFILADDVEILEQDRKVALSRLADVEPGTRLRLIYDTKVRRIELGTAGDKSASGIILEVLPDEKTLKMLVKGEGELRLQVDATTDVTIGLESAELAELWKDDQIDVSYRPGTDSAVVATVIDARRTMRYDRWAILIGIQNLKDDQLGVRPYSNRNTLLVSEALQRRYGLAPEQTLLLNDAPRKDLQDELSQFLNHPAKRSQLVVYLSLPGYLSESGEVLLAGTDFEPDRLAETGIPLTWLIERMAECLASDKLLILDCSRPQPDPPGLTSMSDERLLETCLTRIGSRAGETQFLVATSGEETGGNLADQGQGVFAHHLTTALRGSADLNRDLYISPDELCQRIEQLMAAGSTPRQSVRLMSR